MTPGAYLKHRRCAAGLSVTDVAGKVATEPRIAEHLRGELIELIEADVQPLTLSTIVALRVAFSFDLDVLFAIGLAAMIDLSDAAPRICRICACSERDACRIAPAGAIGNDPVACHWVEQDLCSACACAAEAA